MSRGCSRYRSETLVSTLRFASGAMICVMVQHGALAGDWHLTPTVDFSSIMSDNITLAPPGNEREEHIIRTAPGVSIEGDGRRMDLGFTYQLENLRYPNRPPDEDDSRTYHSFNADASLEPIKDIFHIDTYGSLYQEVVDATGPVALDNVSALDARGDILNFNVQPRITTNLGGVAVTELLYAYGWTDWKERDAFDAEIARTNLNMRSREGQRTVEWSLGFDDNEIDREGSQDARYQSLEGELRYRIARNLSLLLRGGHEDNSVNTTRAIENGSYGSAGARWLPYRNLSLEASYGNRDKEVSMDWKPGSHTSVRMAYRDREVGLVIGPSWNVAVEHQRRSSALAAGYTEETTNVQLLRLGGQNQFTLTGQGGDTALDPDTGQPLLFIEDLFSLTNEDFLRKEAHLSLYSDVGISNLALRAFDETREFDEIGTTEKINGLKAGWTLNLTAKTRQVIDLNWQHREFILADLEDDLWYTGLSIWSRRGPNFSIYAQYWYAGRDTESAADEYRENRIQFGLRKSF